MVKFINFVLLLGGLINAHNSSTEKSPTRTEPNAQSSEKFTETIKHVPVQADRQCCGCGDCPDACSSLIIVTDGQAKSGVVKHVPVAMTRECCGCDVTASYSGGCSVSNIYTDEMPEVVVSSRVRRVTGKGRCETVTDDPKTSFVTVATSTLYTTRISTLRRITRSTSFTTTTVTSTVRLIKTELSISARTITTNLIFTQPSFVLITKYFYVDSTSITTTSAPTFVATFTEIDTIVLNSLLRSTTSILEIESTFFTLQTFFETEDAVLFITFTDPTNFVITEAPSSNFVTVNVPITYTETVFGSTTVSFPETVTIVSVRSSVITTRPTSLVFIDPSTSTFLNTAPVISLAATASYTLLIN